MCMNDERFVKHERSAHSSTTLVLFLFKIPRQLQHQHAFRRVYSWQHCCLSSHFLLFMILLYPVVCDRRHNYLLFFLYNNISNWSCCCCSSVYSKRDTVSLSVSSPYMKPHLQMDETNSISAPKTHTPYDHIMCRTYLQDFCITSARL